MRYFELNLSDSPRLGESTGPQAPALLTVVSVPTVWLMSRNGSSLPGVEKGLVSV